MHSLKGLTVTTQVVAHPLRSLKHIHHFAATRVVSNMKSIVIKETGGLEVLKLIANTSKPLASPGSLVVKNAVSGCNFIDTYHRSGLYPVTLPFTLGVDGSGVVEAVGEGVSDFQAGQRVAYLTQGGSYAEYTAVATNRAVALPDDVSFETGAAAMVQGMTAVFLATQAYPVKKGDYVLVHAAAGGTGQLITQVAAAAGAHVIATVSSEEKAALAQSLGAKDVILYTKHDVAKEVNRITGGRGVQAVYDGVGADTFETSLTSLGHLGTLVSFGNASGKVPPVDLARLLPHNVKLMRPSLFEAVDAEPGAFQQLAQLTLTLIREGKLKVRIYATYPLEEAARAHTDLHGRQTTGKVLLRP